MRRRLFWQIIVLDTFYVERRGSPPILSESAFDTKAPLNIKDEQLSPMTGVIGQAQNGTTEMTFSLLSQSASLTVLRYTSMNPRNRLISEETEELIGRREQVMQQRYRDMHFKFIDCCDPSDPVQWNVAEVGRIIILRLWLLLHRPQFTLRRQTLKPAKREFILASAVSMLELINEIENHPTSAPWVWYMRGYVPWYPIAIILAELCVQTRGILADRGWNIVHKTYGIWGDRVADNKTSGFWRPMKKMFEKARRARLASSSSQSPPELDSQMEPEWTRITTESSLQNGDFKQLHLASVTMALGKPEDLERLLRDQQRSPQVVADQSMPLDNFGGNVDWDDWDNFIQTTIEAENNGLSLGQETLSDSDFGFSNPVLPEYMIQPHKNFPAIPGPGFGP